jgi:hypothetical protein
MTATLKITSDTTGASWDVILSPNMTVAALTAMVENFRVTGFTCIVEMI